MAKIYGDVKVRRGKQHEYPGMDLDYRKLGQVRVSVKPYMDKIIKNLPEEIGSQSASLPAADYLFNVKDEKNAKILPEEQGVQFHHLVV